MPNKTKKDKNANCLLDKSPVLFACNFVDNDGNVYSDAMMVNNVLIVSTTKTI